MRSPDVPCCWVIDEPESRVQVRETDRQSERQTDRVHSIKINPPLLPLNLSIDYLPSAAGGVWGGRRPPHREAKHLGHRGAVFIPWCVSTGSSQNFIPRCFSTGSSAQFFYPQVRQHSGSSQKFNSHTQRRYAGEWVRYATLDDGWCRLSVQPHRQLDWKPFKIARCLC
jgi:hypothetical protein